MHDSDHTLHMWPKANNSTAVHTHHTPYCNVYIIYANAEFGKLFVSAGCLGYSCLSKAAERNY
jgi:hypothetical protein